MLKRSLFTSTVIASGLVASIAISDQAAAQNITLEEIVVTAQRREQDLQSVPVPVSAFTVEQLENRQISQGQDLERYVPSLKMTNNITQPTNLSPSMRGSLQQDASLAVAESPFGIYIDDVYVGRMNGNNTRLADVERIEVLRGPQGTLYGRNTLAGALKFISKTPGEEMWLDGSVSYGNYDAYEASVSTGGPIGDKLAGSIALNFNGHEGYGINVATNENIGQEKNWAGRAKLRYMGGENFDAIAHISYADSRNDANVMVNATTPGIPSNAQYRTTDLVPSFGGIFDNNHPDRDYSGGGLLNIPNQPRGDTEQLITSLTMTYDFDQATLKSVTAYVNTKDYFATDFSGFGGILAGFETESNQWTQELQLQGTGFDDKLNYILGAFYLNERANQDMSWYFFAPTSRSGYDTGTDSYSVFGQADYAITDQLTMTAGLRWTRDEKNWDFNIDYFFAPIPSENIVDSITENSWTPKFGLDYAVNDDTLLFVSAAKGFKSGGFNGINIFDTTVA
ncbi:MAG: TonB-dependent receptor, partial [Rhodospirillaceae bacterium]|nr:TonB-dependent receptor [Rhodospirillaceae bacterium]